MSHWWSHASIRVRLTAWYTVAVSLMLVIYATVTFVAVRNEFREQLEREALGDPIAIEGHAAQTDEERLQSQLREILVVLVLGLPPIVVLAGVGGYVLARRALAPIDRLAAEAHRITADRLHERVSVPNPNDEVSRLAAVMNETLARLESSFDQLRRFTADASHELRTPLAVLRGTGEVALGQTRTAAEYQETLGSMLEEVDRLTRLVETLLQLSRGDAGTIRLALEPVDLGEVARSVVASLGILAEERGQRLNLDAPATVGVIADRLVLREAITNLVDNAIKHSPSGAAVDLRVGSSRDIATITVRDQGPGIARQHRDRIFDRFYRIDEGRSRDHGGSGLGLAIAKWAVEANGGRISLEETDRGAAFRIDLPLARTT